MNLAATPLDSLFRFAERDPHPSLRRWVARCWGFEARGGVGVLPDHHVPPDGCTSLVLVLVPGAPPQLMVSGPWVKGMRVPVTPGARYYGVRFHPGAASVALGLDPSGLRDRSRPALPLLDTWARQLVADGVALTGLESASALFESVLLPEAAHWPGPDPLARSAVLAITAAGGDCEIAALASGLGVSPRTLHRRFRAATGLSPKEFARIQRVRRATVTAMRAAGQSWSAVALEHGYTDQAHLTREFSALTGLTPERLLARLRRTAHHNVEP